MGERWDRDALCAKLSARLSARRFKHSLGVEACAEELAKSIGADREKASVAGLLHDCAKELPGEQARELGQRLGIFEDTWLLAEPVLWHAPLGAHVAAETYGVTDDEILSAIACHTTGKPGMGPLDKIIYLADYIEPSRSFPGIDALRARAREDIDAAMVAAFDNTIYYLVKKGRVLHPLTILARNEILTAVNKKR